MTAVFELSDRAVELIAADNPINATAYGIAGHDDRWPDLSPDGVAERKELYRSLRDEVAACAPEGDDDELARRVLIDACEHQLTDLDQGAHHYELNNIESPHQQVPFVFATQSTDDAEEWERAVRRLETVAQPLEGWMATLEEGRRLGRTVSRRQVLAVVDQGRSVMGERSAFDDLRRRLADSGHAGRFGDRVDRAIESAKATYADVERYLVDRYLPSAVEADAVGRDRYLAGARRFLGADIDPEETYRWGWEEVERLWAEMQRACRRIDADAPVPEVLARLQTDPAYGVEGIDRFLEVMRDRQHRALAELSGVHFDVPDQIRTLEVKVEPPGGALGAQYVGPSEDFSRPGAVWYSVGDKTWFPLFDEVSTAYHEGFPGHHLQVGYLVSLGDRLSRFHRTMAWYSGAGEGWALYAELLMGELGYLERPEYEVGLLATQLLRACRVAIDIGCHLDLPIPDDVGFHPGESWTFELAHRLLIERAQLDDADATSEVTRYLGWPGQAISYKVGERAILDLRDQHRRRPDFDLKTFHRELLTVGAVGLDLLRERMAV